jgi:acylphosphatase
VAEPSVARRVVVSGHVQGVFFRDCTRREAHRRGVAGWVRNCADGTVEAHLEGAAAAVEELVRWCRRGPRHATVYEVRVQDAEPEGLSRFQIR